MSQKLKKKFYGKYIAGRETGFIDFPGYYSMTLFFAGCNLDCWFCHNRDIANGQGSLSLYDAKLLVNELQGAFTTQKVGVVLSGGEPTVSPAFDMAIQTFREHPLAIQTNGIVQPKFDNPFSSVIMSVKPLDVLPFTFDIYIKHLIDSINYYSDCGYKEIRIVNFPEYQDDYQRIISAIGSLTNGWNIRYVEPNENTPERR